METKTTNTIGKRGKANGYKNSIMRAKKARKRQDAETRKQRFEDLTTKQKLATLIPGGSTRQRVRLEALYAAEKAAAKGNTASPKKTAKA